MPDDRQYQELRHGEKLPGIPRRPWNDMLRLLKKDLGGGVPGASQENAVQIRVRNVTGGFLERFSVLAIADPTATYGNDPNLFLTRDLMEGATPSAGATVVITQKALDDGEIGLARLLGLARVKVNLLSSAHQYAGPSTSTTQLTSATSGPAVILWVETDETTRATGVQWAVVLLLGQSSASSTDCGPGCGWVAGLTARDCLVGSVLSATGRCATGTDTAWNPVFAYSSTKWVAADYLSISGVDYEVSFLRDHDPRGGDPQLTLTTTVGSGTTYYATLDCCGDGYAIFAIGVVCTGDTLCPPTTPVANIVRIKVQYAVCPNPDYAGPGWYCVSIDGCTTKTARYLDTDPGVCLDTDTGYFRICFGPYASEADAITLCGITFGDPGTLDPASAPCGGSNPKVPDTLHLSTSNATGGCAADSWTVVPTGPAGARTGLVIDNLHDDHGCQVVVSCSGGNYDLNALGGAGCFCNVPTYLEIVYFTASPWVMVIDMVHPGTPATTDCPCGTTGGVVRFTVTGP